MIENFSFHRLTVYSKSLKLVVEVYKIISTLPANETFALAAQMRRAIVSVPSNIAEGCGRCSFKEKIRFLEISYGSLLEVYCQLEICRELGYISTQILEDVTPKFYDISRLLSGLRKSYQDFGSSK